MKLNFFRSFALLALAALILATGLILNPVPASASSVAKRPQASQLAQSACTYTVRYGDTMFGIAARYRISIWELMRINNLYFWGWIYAGQTLRVPCGSNDGGNTANCTYRALYVADITIPDQSVLAPGERYTKVWRVQNAGTCTWGPGYALHSLSRVSGWQLGAPEVVELDRLVLPNSTVDVAIPIVAPTDVGRYLSEWKFNVDNGKALGVGWTGLGTLYMDFYIGVQPLPMTRINFAPGATSAVVNGISHNAQDVRFIAGARGGQTMSVLLLGIVPTPAALSIEGADGQMLLGAAAGKTDFTGVLPSTQDYIIVVTPSTADDVNFAMQVSIQ